MADILDTIDALLLESETRMKKKAEERARAMQVESKEQPGELQSPYKKAEQSRATPKKVEAENRRRRRILEQK